MARHDPAPDADERTMLSQFLDYHRATLLWKAEELDQAQLNATAAASDLTLGGLLEHLALVEDWWFRQILHGAEPVAPWDTVDWDADPDWDLAQRTRRSAGRGDRRHDWRVAFGSRPKRDDERP